MKLYLLRHGRAAPRDSVRFANDELRPLTGRGEEQVRTIGRSLRRLDLGINLIWFSPLVRTRQTAIVIAEECAMKNRVYPQDALSPEGDHAKLLGRIDALNPHPESLLLVGHEPYFSRLLSLLTAGSAELTVKLKKGGLVRLEISGPIATSRCAILEWLIPPHLLSIAN